MSGFFQKAIAVVLSILTSFFSMSFFGPKNPNESEDALMTVAFMSDTHITKELYRRIVLVPGLRDISRNVRPDLFVAAGDCTDNGNEENWAAFQKTLDKHLTVQNRLIAFGNHDTWTSYDTPHDYAPARANFIRYAGAIMGKEIDEVYFTYELNGCHFIVLGSEGTSVGMDITDAQLAWLDAAMAEAAEPGKPIFVVSHQPLNFTHAVGDNEHGNGIDTEGASEKLQAILDKYENVFLFSGHQHYGLNDGSLGYPEGFTTVEKVGEHITSVNLPSYEYGSLGTGGHAFIGQGLVMNVYPDRVELLGRNFALGQWVKTVNVSVPVK